MKTRREFLRCAAAVAAGSVGPLLAPAAGASPAESPEKRYRWVRVAERADFAPRDGAGALAFDGKMWLLGGWNPGDKTHFPKICNSEVWTSTDGLKWKLQTHAPWEGRHTAGYVVHDGKLWIVGGDANQRHYQNDVWSSPDGTRWTKVADRVPWGNRVLHHTLAFQGKIWVMGGQTLPQFAVAQEAFYNDIWNSTDGVHWNQVAARAPWSPRGMIGGSVVMADRIWIMGGGTYDTPTTPRRKLFNDAGKPIAI